MTGTARAALVTGAARGVPRDLRLALAAAAAWLALACCQSRSVRTACIVGIGGLLVGGAGLLGYRRRWARVAAAASSCGFCVALVVLSFAGRSWQARASPLAQLAAHREQVDLQLVTTGDPQPLAAKGVAGSPRVSVRATAQEVTAAGRRWRVSDRVLVLAPAAAWRGILPGQRVRVDGDVQPSLDGPAFGVTLFTAKPPTLVGHPPWWQRAAGEVRASLRRAATVLPPDEQGLLPGLVDGDTSRLDPVLQDRFRIAGLTHLVAVSGTNCSIVLGAVLLVLRRAGARPGWCAAAGLLVLVAFVVVARPSPSVLRAALMALIGLVSLASGRPRNAVPALAATTLALLTWDPLLAQDAGFVMSVLATGALLLIAPGWADTLRRHRVPAGVAEALAVATAAHLVTAPVVAAMSGRVSLVAIPANLLAEPAVPVATVLGFAAAVLAPLWSGGGTGLAWLAGWPCRWLVAVADRFGGLAGASLTWPGGLTGGLALLALTVLLVVFVRRAGIWRALAIGALLAVLVQIPARTFTSGWPPKQWDLIACDVGQGDALLLPAGAHAAVEIDAGPDPIAIDRCLRALGITDIPLLVLTHYHLDHVGGLPGVLHGRTLGKVITGPLADPASGVELVHAALAARHLTIATPAVSSTFGVGGVQLQVLAPVRAFHETRSDPNNSSLVTRATVGDVHILLSGDVEIEAQQQMLHDGVDVRADVLKVPHHGSAYSDPQFLAAVGAQVGVISVGLHNDYGHPSPVLLAELARLGMPVRRTDHDGDVAVVGPRAALSTVVHGTAASHAQRAVRSGSPADGAVPTVRSEGAAWMDACPRAEPVRSRSTSCPIRWCRWSCSSATRNCSCPARSARSPPSCAVGRRTSSRPSAPAARSTAPSCTSSSGRRCSVTRRCWWCAPPRICAPPRSPCSRRT